MRRIKKYYLRVILRVIIVVITYHHPSFIFQLFNIRKTAIDKVDCRFAYQLRLFVFLFFSLPLTFFFLLFSRHLLNTRIKCCQVKMVCFKVDWSFVTKVFDEQRFLQCEVMSQGEWSGSAHNIGTSRMIVIGLYCYSFESELSRKVNCEIEENASKTAPTRVLLNCEYIEGGYCLVSLIWFNTNRSYNLVFLV